MLAQDAVGIDGGVFLQEESIPQRSPDGATMTVLIAGVSDGPVCGVRDHARLLSAALRDSGLSVTTVWIDAAPGSRRLSTLDRELQTRCREERPDAILLHYSVFAFSERGIPAGVPALAARLRRLGVPVVLLAHEFAYPWGRRGWQGTVYAATQRAALVPLVAVSAAVVVTTPERVLWLRTRRWLPQRPVTFAPVFSNISPHPSSTTILATPGRIGLFSFGAEGLAVELVTGAVADVAERSPGSHLALIGAPGPDSPAGERWRRAAAAAGCPLTFTGVAEEAEVSRQIAACQLIVFADPAGPSLRKTSLAAALAHGRAVVALDGPQAWGDLIKAGGVVVVDPTRTALGNELQRLQADDAGRAAAGRRALLFAEKHLGAARAAATVFDALDSAAGTRRIGRGSTGSTTHRPWRRW